MDEYKHQQNFHGQIIVHNKTVQNAIIRILGLISKYLIFKVSEVDLENFPLLFPFLPVIKHSQSSQTAHITCIFSQHLI